MVLHFLVLLLLSYDRLSKKPLLFKSFTGLTVQEFNDLYNKKIIKNMANMSNNVYHLKGKTVRERKDRAGRRFKLNVKNKFLMLLVYYRLYITYTLAGFLFNLDQSNICRDIQKIEPLIRNCLPIPLKVIRYYKKEASNS